MFATVGQGNDLREIRQQVLLYGVDLGWPETLAEAHVFRVRDGLVTKYENTVLVQAFAKRRDYLSAVHLGQIDAVHLRNKSLT